MLLDNGETFLIDRVKRKAFFEMNKAHFHPYYEIYYLISGTRRMFINHTLYTVDKGSLIMIGKSNPHRTTFITDDPHERVVVNFTDDFLQPLYQEIDKTSVVKCFEDTHIVIPVSRRAYIEELFMKMKYESDLRDDFSKLLIRSYFYELVVFLLRCQAFQNNHIEELDGASGKIQEMARYICENYDKQITLEDISKNAKMSTTYFSKKFKKITGFGFKEYLNNIRLREASHLLIESKHSITEIALKCGFTDSNYFGDVFKKMKGISPNQYRKNKGAI
ncbi:helix-turn-helix domain-containing protein [Cellulosilyticum sp. I15G10I2]|uniref:helix-turn-helix domain-containing protein n=1 Tax=Cellulosilyticum sp. I15G10I2 TaxID=1892843 RepID=UPI00085CBF3C|nr:AraC family transcriptional regulator [Cellulosilyticum sp. I15G10I2]